MRGRIHAQVARCIDGDAAGGRSLARHPRVAPRRQRDVAARTEHAVQIEVSGSAQVGGSSRLQLGAGARGQVAPGLRIQHTRSGHLTGQHHVPAGLQCDRAQGGDQAAGIDAHLGRARSGGRRCAWRAGSPTTARRCARVGTTRTGASRTGSATSRRGHARRGRGAAYSHVARGLGAHVLAAHQQGASQRQVLPRRDTQRALRLQRPLRGDRHVTLGIHIDGSARANDALDLCIAAGGKHHIARRLRRAIDGQVAPSRKPQIARCLHGGTGRDAHVARRADLQVARQGHQVSAHIDANAGLGADQPDAVGIHAAQRGSIQRHRGRGSFARPRRDRARRVVHARRARRHVELVGPHARVDLQRPGDQVDLTDAGAVQAVAFNADLARRHVQRDVSVGTDLGPSGGQGRPVRVQEAAAVAGDARRVGDDDIGPVARDLQRAHQSRGIRRGDLVQDGGGALIAQHDVARHLPGKLGLTGAAAIVQHYARRPHVELRVAVVGHPTGGRRRNVDDGHAIVDAHRWLLAGHAFVDRDRQGLRQHRRPYLRENDGPDDQRTKLGHHAHLISNNGFRTRTSTPSQRRWMRFQAIRAFSAASRPTGRSWH
ncbi:hypothetical protein D3C85_162190 [compost metagenome]